MTLFDWIIETVRWDLVGYLCALLFCFAHEAFYHIVIGEDDEQVNVHRDTEEDVQIQKRDYAEFVR